MSQRNDLHRPTPFLSLFVSAALSGFAAIGCGGGGGDAKDAAPGGNDAKEAGPTGGDAAGDAGGDSMQPPDMAPGGMLTTHELTILHTNDLHSHLMGHSPEADYSPATLGDDSTVGGFARLATKIGAEKMAAAAAGRQVLLLDAGDFMMGTLFELLSTAKAAELKLMAALGYDAITLGNHEFDWTPKGLAGILNAAMTEGVNIPIVASNMKFDPASADDDALEAFKDPGPIKTKFVKTVGTLKVGFFGLLGKDAADVTPQARPVTFEDAVTAAKRMIAELRDTDKVDLVVALSHSGISANGKGEDADLAMKAPGIDVIISGHTHEKLAAPAKVGSTIIVTAGAYGANLGKLELTVTKQGQTVKEVAVKSYTLADINDQIPGNAAVQTGIDMYIAGLDMALMPAGVAYKKVIAETAFDLLDPAYRETGIGDLVTDAYRAITSAVQMTEPPDIAVEANGQIRSPLPKGKTGNLWFADVFRVLPLGIGPDARPGYPLVTIYLNGKDLKAGMELSAATETLGKGDYFLQVSGLQMEYKPANALFGRVTSLTLVPTGGGTPQPIDMTDTTKCYKVVSTYYVASLLGLVKSLTSGLLSVEAKEKDCTTLVTDLTARLVDADPAAAGVQELKQWQAFVKYLSSLPDADADMVPDLPAPYAMGQGRVIKL